MIDSGDRHSSLQRVEREFDGEPLVKIISDPKTAVYYPRG